jgi:hypothetical protein
LRGLIRTFDAVCQAITDLSEQIDTAFQDHSAVAVDEFVHH